MESFFKTIKISEIISSTLILFAVIDILGSIPLIISLREKAGKIYSGKATIAAGAIMLLFLFVGEGILSLFHLDVASFALAGSLVIFLLALEMILGISLFKSDPDISSTSIVPIAFPLIAGAGTLTTILSLEATYALPNIIIGMIVNLLVVYIVLKCVPWLQRKLGKNGVDILRRVFGIILLAIAIKLFKQNLGSFL